LNQPLLEVSGLSCERNERLLFGDLSLEIAQQQVLQIAGPNGSGKTTLLRILAGLMPAMSGDFCWRGRAVASPHEYSDELIFLGHRAAIKDRLTPLEMLSWYAAIRHSRALEEEHSLELLSRVGLRGYEQTLCHQLSAGQKRRVALATLHLSDTALWILDEPFTAIDRQGTSMLEEWIAEQTNRGGSVIFTTHQPVNLKVQSFSVLELPGVEA
jgi:heme exporter protein A